MNKAIEAWGEMKKNDLVWYACYGTNLSRERFMRYVRRCADSTAPRESRPYRILRQLYFAKSSPKWDDKGLAFINPKEDGTAMTLGRVYLISRAQYEEIRFMECGKNLNGWYKHELVLGTLGKYPVCTFTAPGMLAPNPPSEKYLDVLRAGLSEAWPELGKEALEKYLAERMA